MAGLGIRPLGRIFTRPKLKVQRSATNKPQRPASQPHLLEGAGAFQAVFLSFDNALRENAICKLNVQGIGLKPRWTSDSARQSTRPTSSWNGL